MRLPDLLPHISVDFELVGGDFPEQEAIWDSIVTELFVDTSLNILAAHEHIHTLIAFNELRIDLGPLLCQCSGTAKTAMVQLSLSWTR
ncbi:hypothetical protein CYLTODRAFT_427619 [Cylindrobasidium torrendii FP15055 ss-10]|uniref:Uncharacterized protein n=1 Tax=Cylindrobasidium torrendii FP15055 ss-10 TaxID=1314674 RepID=A0A0D7AVG8_9AGAR|nr:hypothetical protein CYLTODRAFT_427619 [Cylindrobasidium torrendii FP15055 ss-10]